MANNNDSKKKIPEGLNSLADYETIKEIDFTSFLEENSKGSPLFEGFHEDIENTEKSITNELQSLYDDIMSSGPATIVPKTMSALTAKQAEPEKIVLSDPKVTADNDTSASLDDLWMEPDDYIDIPVVSLDEPSDSNDADILKDDKKENIDINIASPDDIFALPTNIPDDRADTSEQASDAVFSSEINDIFGMIDDLKADTNHDEMFADLISEIEANPNILPVDNEISSAASLVENYPENPLSPPRHSDEAVGEISLGDINEVLPSDEEPEIDLSGFGWEGETNTQESENSLLIEETDTENGDSVFDETLTSGLDYAIPENDNQAFEPSADMLDISNIEIPEPEKSFEEMNLTGAFEAKTADESESENINFTLDDEAFFAISKAIDSNIPENSEAALLSEQTDESASPDKKAKRNKKKSSKQEEKELFGIEALEKDYNAPVEENKNNQPKKAAKKSGAGEVVRKIILTLSIITIVVSCGILVNTYLIEPYKFKSNSGKLSEQMIESINTHEDIVVDEEIKAANPDINYPDGMLAKYAQLYAVNDDLRGWISIGGLSIDLPIAQYSNNEYYLKKDIYGKYTTYGVPFFDYRITDSQFRTLPKNIVVYGHNMRRDDYIFGMLENYRTINGYLSAPVIECNTIYGDHTWLVYGVFITNAYKKDDNGYVFNYNFIDLSDASFASYIKELDKRKLYTTGTSLEPTDNILTLSTCCYDFDNARLVVVAREKREGEVISADSSKCYINQNPKYPQAWYDTYNKSNPYADDANW